MRGKRARVLATFQLTIGPREVSAPAGSHACFVANPAISQRLALWRLAGLKQKRRR
jgi:hypothetical protein